MKTFEKGQRVTYTGYSETRQGAVVSHFCDHGDHFVGIRFDGGTSEREVSEDLVEPVKGDRIEDLTLLAETLNKARLQANNINGADGDIYRTISGSLDDVLGAIAGDEQVGYRIYSYVLDGSTVREALTLEEGI
jgi:hypothetical protein